MSTKRVTRLTATAMVLVGATATTLVFTAPEFWADTEGTLWFPVVAILGVALLVTNRPRRGNA